MPISGQIYRTSKYLMESAKNSLSQSVKNRHLDTNRHLQHKKGQRCVTKNSRQRQFLHLQNLSLSKLILKWRNRFMLLLYSTKNYLGDFNANNFHFFARWFFETLYNARYPLWISRKQLTFVGWNILLKF